jgi:hypothetical protein
MKELLVPIRQEAGWTPKPADVETVTKRKIAAAPVNGTLFMQ